MWVANSGGNSVTEVNASSGSFVANLADGNYNFSLPEALAFSSGLLDNSSVTEIDAADGAWLRSAAGSSYGLADPVRVAVTGKRVWASNAASGSLTELPPG